MPDTVPLGEIVDTNSAFLAADLARRGVDVLWSQRVGDNLGRVKFALESALSRSDAVILCGGLGPTDDDLTREAIASVLGETPAVDAGLEQIEGANGRTYVTDQYAVLAHGKAEREFPFIQCSDSPFTEVCSH